MAKQKDAGIKSLVNMTKPTPETANVRKARKIDNQVYLVRQNIQKYLNAVNSAQNIQSPQRYALYELFKRIELDAHLSAAIQQRKNLVLSKDFVVLGKDGKENEEKTALIQSKWFFDYLDLALDSMYYGFSLIQFNDIVDDEFKSVELVPRIYVKPELHITVVNYTDLTGNDYLESPFKEWCIGVGKTHDLGLLMKAAPLVIWKNNALGAWAEFIEIFGTPTRIGKTDARDEVTTANMEVMLKNMATSAWGLFDLSDEIQLIETKRTDAYQVFDNMINRCNSEISKLILGETATMDEKSFVGSAEVHERILNAIGERDEVFIEGVNKYQLIPLLNGLGFGFEGCKIECRNEDGFTDINEKSKFDIELIKTGRFTMTPEYIKEKYGTEVIEVTVEANTVNSVKAKLNNLYE